MSKEDYEARQAALRLSLSPHPDSDDVSGVMRDGPGEEELAICHFYNSTGNMAETARYFQMPVYEVQKLTRTGWWNEELKAVRAAEAAANNARFTIILNRTLEAIEDRLTNGDTVLDKEGFKHQVPVEAATLVKLADMVFSKRQIIQNLPTAITKDSSKIEELARRLEQLGAAQSTRTLENKSES